MHAIDFSHQITPNKIFFVKIIFFRDAATKYTPLKTKCPFSEEFLVDLFSEEVPLVVRNLSPPESVFEGIFTTKNQKLFLDNEPDHFPIHTCRNRYDSYG